MGCGSSSPDENIQPGKPEDNPIVYFDITIGGKEAGRIEMTLRADVVPKTAEVSFLNVPVISRSILHFLTPYTTFHKRILDVSALEKRAKESWESHSILKAANSIGLFRDSCAKVR
jgi:hypothetical protein